MSDLDRDRLAKILALLGSDQPGEQMAALAAAGRLLQAAGMRWQDLVTTAAGPSDGEARMALLLARYRSELATARSAYVALDTMTARKDAELRRLTAENRARRRDQDDLRARLEIAARENAALRRKLQASRQIGPNALPDDGKESIIGTQSALGLVSQSEAG